MVAEAEAQLAEPPSAAPAEGLSEVWSVEAKHIECYTGGKVAWSKALHQLGCLASEELHLVDVATQLPTRKVTQEGDGILTFAFDPSGENVVTTHRSGLLRHFRLAESAVLARSWKAHDELVADVCFDATGNLLATGCVDHTARVWDFAGYFCTHSFRGHDGIVSMVKFHPARLHLVTVAGTEVRLWDLTSSTCIGMMKDHLASISSLSFAHTPGGLYQLVTGGRDQIVNVWRLEDSCPLARTIPVFENVEGVACVPTRNLRKRCAEVDIGEANPLQRWLQTEEKLPAYVIFTAGDKALLRAWNPSNGQCVAEVASPHGASGLFRQVLSLDQAECQQLLTIGDDLNLIVWNLPELQVVSYIMGQNGEIVHVQLIPELSWPSGAEGDLKVSASRFVCITNDEHPRLVNCQGFGATLLRGHTDMVIACDVSPDGQWIATGGKDQTVRVWSTKEAKCACRLAGHAGSVSSLSFAKKRPRARHSSAGGPLWLVSGSQDKTMKIWELKSAAKLEKHVTSGKEELFVEKAKVAVIAHSKEVNDITVSPNNKLIASGGQDKLVRLWKFPEGDLLGECSGHARAVWCVAFSPTDQVIASASGDNTVRLWNLKDYSPIRAFQGHMSAVLRVQFLSHGMQIMTSGADGLLKLWHIRTAECAATFEEHTGKVWCIDMIDQQMVSGGSDSKLCMWRDTTVEHVKERHKAEAEEAMKDSKIGMLVHDGKIEAALTLALDLNRPGQMRQILIKHTMDVVETCITRQARARADGKGTSSKEGFESTSATRPTATEEEPLNTVDLHQWVLSLSSEQLEKLVDLVEQWNSNRRMASIAQMLMSLVLLAVPPSKLMGIEGMNATSGNILSYLSRHMVRVESLLQKTYLFDLVLQSNAFGLALEEPQATDGKALSGHAAGATAEEALRQTMDVLLGEEDKEAEAEAEDGRGGAVDAGSEEEEDEPAPVRPRSADQQEVLPEPEEDPDTGDDEAGDASGEGATVSRARKRRCKVDGASGSTGRRRLHG